MKRWGVLIFMILSLIIYAQSSSIYLQPEHQAYVLCLGLEHTPEGRVKLTALCPDISGESSSKYQTFESEGDSVSLAVQALELAVPRHLVYVQLKALILSEEFAASDQMEDLIYYFLLGGEFYSESWVMIAPEAPSAVIGEFEPVIGTRLSAAIQAETENAVQSGAIPRVYLADMIDGWDSVFGDVVAVSVHRQKWEDTTTLVPDGAALFSDRRLALQLSAEETMLLNCIRGSRKSFSLSVGSDVISMRADFALKVSFDYEQNAIVISGKLAQFRSSGSIAADELKAALEARIAALIRKCQAANTEPFLFSQKAAAGCIDLDAYQALDFRSFYQNADVRVNIDIRDELA